MKKETLILKIYVLNFKCIYLFLQSYGSEMCILNFNDKISTLLAAAGCLEVQMCTSHTLLPYTYT